MLRNSSSSRLQQKSWADLLKGEVAVRTEIEIDSFMYAKLDFHIENMRILTSGGFPAALDIAGTGPTLFAFVSHP